MNPYVLGKLKEWKASPLLFATECLGVIPSNQQAELLAAAGKNKRISVRSGHGSGKSSAASWLILWFLSTRPYAKVVCVAPTARQLSDILWSEISKWLRQSILADEFVVQADKIFQKDSSKEWWCRAVSPASKSSKEEQSETLAGFHGDHLMIVCDEACHDDKTEVLTEEGFKLFSDLTGRERVLTKDPETEFASYVYPEEYIEYDYDGDMYYYESDNLDFAVTPDHRLFFSTQHNKEVKLSKIKEIGKIRLSMPKGFKWQGVHINTFSDHDLYQDGWFPFDMKMWLCFLGFFISEGSFIKDKQGIPNGISISQLNPEGRKAISSVLSALGFNFYTGPVQFIIRSRSLAAYLSKHCGDGFANKKVPEIIKQLTPELINLFLQAFCIGDGYFKPNGDSFRRIFYTSSIPLCNDIQELLFKAGYNATVQYRKLKGQVKWIKDHFATSSVDGFMIGESSTDTPFSVRMENVKVRHYTGKVYCLSVPPTELLFTRRNGKCFWSGNSGINDPVYIPLEGALTQEDNRVLLIGNPTKNTGYFHDTQFSPVISKAWKKFHWDSRKSSNVSKEMIQYFTDKYGEDSNVFRIRVAGEPPTDDSSSFIPLSWALNCVGNEIEIDDSWPLTLSVDVARFGDDVSIVMPRKGNKIFPWDEYGQFNTIELANRILGTFNDLDAYIVGVDSIGVGGGTLDWLQHDPRGVGPRKAVGVNVTEASSDKKYHRLRDQLWGMVRDNCMKAKYSFPNVTVKRCGVDLNLGNELADELASVKYFIDNRGAIQIESKRDMKARGVKSPNVADSLCISEYISPMTMSLWSRSNQAKERPFDRARPHQRQLLQRDSWMTT